jgi:putative ABC transport system substrate-binding protein
VTAALGAAIATGAVFTALFATPHSADAQQPVKGHRIGLLVFASASSFAPRVDAFRHGLRERGYVEGQNVFLEYRYAEGQLERLPALAAELAALKVDVIVTSSTPAIRAAMQATRTIPIVMANVADPVQSGLVASLARPGGNVTGVSNLAPEVDGKRLALLKEALPKVARVGFILDPANRALALRLGELRTAARALGIALQSVEVGNPGELESAFEAIARERVGALIVPAPIASLYGRRIVQIALRQRVPAMYDARQFAAEGGMMAYGPDFLDLHRRAATYVDKILKGARPADLPVEQPTKFELIINLKTAKALDVAIPPAVLARADEVIQ